MSQAAKDLVHLAHLLKTPRIGAMAEPVAERARAEAWSYEEYLAAVLEAETAARNASGSQSRIKGRACPPERPSTPSTSCASQRCAHRSPL